jgi:Aldos-2-ulose dehydratase, beta-propeller domain/FG-GAP-like repeat
MKYTHRFILTALACLATPAFLLTLPGLLAAPAAGPFPSFQMQELEKGLGVGYAVLLVDVNNDGKKDIVVVDKTRVVWYENPTWKRRKIIENQTRADNVCIAAADIDGDGKIDFALGAGWANLTSKASGPLYWIRRGKSLDEPWQVFPVGNEPSVHRIRLADLDGDGRPELLVFPLLGRNSTPKMNFMDVPVRMLAFRIPKDPTKDRWVPEVLYEKLHVSHNFYPIPSASGKGSDVLVASYEGVNRLHRQGSKWVATKLGVGNQDNPESKRGSSEVKMGHLGKDRPFIATIEPWHGNQVVVYTPPAAPGKLWDRHLLDDQLKWGHAVWPADIDGDGIDELVVGVRDDLSQNPGERRGVRIYKATDGKGAKWDRHLIDPGGVAVEDLAAADLDGDGHVDIVAVGRQTHNVRIYWNKGKK